MGVSSNLRYQAVFGAERAVDKALAGRLPQLAYVTSLIIRFGNNIVGGEQFVDSGSLDRSAVRGNAWALQVGPEALHCECSVAVS